MFRYLILAFIFLGAPNAFAQDETAIKAAVCSRIDDSLARLTCFDKLFPRDAAKSETLENEQDDALGQPTIHWSIEITKSPIDDSTQVFASLEPKSVSGTGIGDSQALLLLRCMENTTSAILATNMFMTDDTVSVITRVGEKEASSDRWDRSTSYKSVGLWSGSRSIPFIESLTDNTRLVVRIEEDDRIDAQFDLADVSAVRQQLSSACNWPD